LEELVKSVVMLWVACLKEAGDQHHVRVHRDLAYAESRIEDEGYAFLAITLPTFEKDFLTGISRGYVGSDLFHGFRRRGGLPAFLSGFLFRVFDADGVLRPDADPTVIRSVRQVLLLVSKIEIPTSRKREADALRAYVETDAQLEELPEVDLGRFRDTSRRLLGAYLSAVESRLWSGDWIPRHSSGALATGESYNLRYANVTWTERLNEVFPWWEDLAVNPHEIRDLMEDVQILARDHEPPVKVALVPKTLKSPRIIAEEPCWMQFVQQGILNVMTEVLLQPKFRALARIFSWMDQEPNRLLAQIGSLDGSFATIDLSEASDRVSLQLVENLLASAPFLRKCVLAARSETAKLPTGETVVLKKFASMGSSLCFPIESMVFFIIASMACAESTGSAPSALRVRDLPRLRVYGDDLIVPETAARSLTDLLETYGLKVNSRKSFTTGLFRESCGADWFKGVDVTVFRLKSVPPESERQPRLIAKAISFHNVAFGHGWFRVAETMEGILRDVLPRIPRVWPETKVSALWSFEGPFAVRTCDRLHRPMVRSVVFRQNKPIDPLTGYGAFKKFLSPHSEDREKNHLERDGRSRYAGVHIGWVVRP